MQQDLPENNVVRNFAPKRIKLPLTYLHNEQYYFVEYKWRCLSSKTFKTGQNHLSSAQTI
jgi:hypothetical protein